MRWLCGVLLLVACGDDPQLGPIDAPPGPEVDAPEVDAPEVDAPPPIDAPLAIDARTLPDWACNTNLDCDPDELCAPASIGFCESTGGWGTCYPRPTSCPPPAPDQRPACGCDGQQYPSVCDANAAGAHAGPGSCPADAELYPCGQTYCRKHTEYCKQLRYNDDQPRRYFSCEPMGPQPACPAIMAQPCPYEGVPDGETCTESAGDGTAHYGCLMVLF